MAQRIHGQERGEGKKWQAVFFPQFVKGKTVSLLPDERSCPAFKYKPNILIKERCHQRKKLYSFLSLWYLESRITDTSPSIFMI